jgi:hypothetical protein
MRQNFEPAALTADLAPQTTDSTQDLANARRAVVQSILSGQRTNFSQTPLQAQPPDVETLMLASEIEGQSQSLPAQRVFRRSVTPFSRLDAQSPASGASIAGQVVSHSFGPFRDALDNAVFIDVTDPIPLIGFQRQRETSPFLYVSQTQLSGTSNTIELEAGSVWIVASQFSTNVPTSTFIGLQISKGTIKLNDSLPLGSPTIIIPGGFSMTVALALAPQTPAAVPFYGPSSVSTPANVLFSFTDLGGKLTEADQGQLSAFGSSVSLSFSGGESAAYNSVLGRLEFAFGVQNQSFAVKESNSPFVTVSGNAVITGASWSLPITTSDASSLGAAAGSGGMALELSQGLEMVSKNLSIRCGSCMLLSELSALTMVGTSGQSMTVSPPSPAWFPPTLTLQASSPFEYAYSSLPGGIELLGLFLSFTVNLNQPRTVNNDRIRFAGTGTLILIQQNETTTVRLTGKSQTTPTRSSYAIKNLLLGTTSPSVYNLAASYDHSGPVSSVTTLQSGLRFLIPFLPDPYAASLPFNPRSLFDSTPTLGNLIITITVKNGSTTIGITLPSGALRTLPAQSDANLTESQSFASAIASTFREDEAPTAVLLDLSTNISQFGISLNPPYPARDQAVDVEGTITPDLFLALPTSSIRVVTLPAVQWEPVISPARGIPSPFNFDNSGQMTQFVNISLSGITPAAPRQAIDALLAAYNSTPPTTVGALFTLPFGINAGTVFSRPTNSLVGGTRLSQVQPAFSGALPGNLTGGDQLSMLAVQGTAILAFASPSPALPGYAAQTLQSITSGNPPTTTRLSVLSPDVDGTFNSTFSTYTPGSSIVPVTRIDISGFGESLFSDWRNKTTETTAVAKVQFEVVTGRTALEVVQVYSIVYPPGFQVIRTMTLERLNSGVVTRQKSGPWRANTVGTFAFPNSSISTHPGVIQGVSNVTNIRDLGSIYTVPGTVPPITLAAILYDGMMTIQDVTAGQGPDGTVPVKDQLGYVQITTGNPLLPGQYAEMLAAVGPLGGLIDCRLNIGESGLQMRVSRISVEASSGTDTEFVVATWGAPVLPGGGQWSFLNVAGASELPTAVTGDAVPLIRQGVVGQPANPSYPYRFADPADLLPVDPANRYGICYTTGTQRLLFLEPVIATQGPPAVTALGNNIPVLLADPYVLATSTGPFPPLNLCLQFGVGYSLNISTTGDFALQLPTTGPIQLPESTRVTSQSPNFQNVIYASNDSKNPSLLTLAIDTAASIPFSMNITNLSIAQIVPTMASAGSDGEVSRIVGDILGSSDLPTTAITNSLLQFGSVLEPVSKCLAFLREFGVMPDLSLGMTNDWAMVAGFEFDLANATGPLAFLQEIFQNLSLTVNVSITWDTTTNQLTTGIDVDFSLLATFGEEFLVTVVGDFTFHSGTDGSTYVLQLGGGFGLGYTVGPFAITATADLTVTGILGDHMWGFGVVVLVTANLDAVIVHVGITAELSQTFLSTECNKGASETRWGITQASVAVNLSICWVVNTNWAIQTQSIQTYSNVNGGCLPLDPAAASFNGSGS